jgi:hypothetical protein
VFIGGKILDSDEGEAVLAEFESRLIDSEARMREYDAVLGDREQELSLTHRVSKQQATPPPAHPRPRVSHFARRLTYFSLERDATFLLSPELVSFGAVSFYLWTCLECFPKIHAMVQNVI